MSSTLQYGISDHYLLAEELCKIGFVYLFQKYDNKSDLDNGIKPFERYVT